MTHPHTLFCVAVSPFRYITHPKDNPNRRRLTCCGCFTDLHAIRILCVSLAPTKCTRSTNLGASDAAEVGVGGLLVSFITVVDVVVTSVYCMYNTWGTNNAHTAAAASSVNTRPKLKPDLLPRKCGCMLVCRFEVAQYGARITTHQSLRHREP